MSVGPPRHSALRDRQPDDTSGARPLEYDLPGPVEEGNRRTTMRLTTKVIAGVLIAGFLATCLALPPAAEAGGRYYGGYHGSSSSYFWGGLAAGAVTGLV